jgi:hypothetical protein
VLVGGMVLHREPQWPSELEPATGTRLDQRGFVGEFRRVNTGRAPAAAAGTGGGPPVLTAGF